MINLNDHKDYTIYARRKNRTDITLSVTCYIASAFLYVYSVLVEGVKYGSLLQFLSLFLIVIGVYVNQRYTWTNFIYSVKATENMNSGDIEGYSFYVYKVQGKKSTCLVNVPCKDCIKLVKRERGVKSDGSISVDKDAARYSFTQTMMPDIYYTAVFNADGGTAHISFEPDEVMISLLSAYIID